MDKVREYINFTFKNPIDREIIFYLSRSHHNREQTASEIFRHISPCNRATFDKRLEALRSPRMNALTREIATPEDIRPRGPYVDMSTLHLDPVKWQQGKTQEKTVPPPPRHRLPFIYRISPPLDAKLRDVRGLSLIHISEPTRPY